MDMKCCKKCKEVKPISEFYKYERKGEIWLKAICISCEKVRMKLWRVEDGIKNSRPINPNNVIILESYINNYQDSSKKDKLFARDLARYTYLHGGIIKSECEMKDNLCSGGLEMHHDNYLEPLLVRWLCRYHHGELARLRRWRIVPESQEYKDYQLYKLTKNDIIKIVARKISRNPDGYGI